MTHREEVRFKVFTKQSEIVNGRNFPLELIDFIKGDGTYEQSTINI